MKLKKKIGIIGLGYVGLPLLLLVNKRYDVLGFDLSLDKVNSIKKNLSYISDIPNSELKKVNKKNIFSMKQIKNISKCDYIILCLPTPLKKNRPDMTYIISAFNKIFKFLKKNQTLILESSVFPGATKEIFEKKLIKKFNIGQNFFVGYSPERIDPGKDKYEQKLEYKKITKLVSGFTKRCNKKVSSLYQKIFEKIYVCKSVEVAETAKIFENIFRSVNIALVNEMKMVTHKLKLNIHDVVDAAASKPFGFRKFSPGPGVGGHCIPIDPIFMTWLAKKKGQKTKFINLSTIVNNNVTDWIIRNILRNLTFKKNTSCLIMGIAYKKNINDYRESPSLKIFEKLRNKKGFIVEACDPYIDKFIIKKRLFKTIKVKDYKKYDCVIILTDHTKFDYEKINRDAKLIFDTRGVYKDKKNKKIIHL